jgi:outer membrane protein assembly factor BamA
VSGGVRGRAARPDAAIAVRDFRDEGLQRIEPGSVFANLPSKQGGTFTDENATGSSMV